MSESKEQVRPVGRPSHQLVEIAKLNVPPEMAEALRYLAEFTGVSVREICRVAVAEHLGRLGLLPGQQKNLSTTYTPKKVSS